MRASATFAPPSSSAKITNGYRAMWAAQGEADIRTVVATARLTPGTNIFGTIAATLGAGNIQTGGG